MLFEDWQKWLDSQFLDAQNAGEQQDNVDLADNVSITSQANHIDDISQQTSSDDVSADAPTIHLNQRQQDSKPKKQLDPTVYDNISDVDVPTIDKYLPQFRKSTLTDVSQPTITPQELPPSASNDCDHESIKEELITEQIRENNEAILPENTIEIVSVAQPVGDIAPDTALVNQAEEPPEEVSAEVSPVIEIKALETEVIIEETPVIQVEPTKMESDSESMGIKPVRPTRQTRNTRRSRNDNNLTRINIWEMNPRRLEVILSMNPSSESYSRELKEQRIQNLKVLTDPTISHMNASRILKSPIYIAHAASNGCHLIHMKFDQGAETSKMAEIMAFLESHNKSNKFNTL